MDEQRDEKIWQMAKKRADFQRSLSSYFIVNAFLWVVWWFTIGRKVGFHGVPWPAWVMIGWGIGLVFQYLNAYGGSKKDLIDKGYEQLQNNKN